MQKLAKKHQMVLVVPVYEVEMTGVYFNTAASHRRRRPLSRQIPQAPHSAIAIRGSGKFYFTPGNAGYPVFQTRYARVGVVYLLRPPLPGRREILGLNGAEIVYNLPPLSPASPNIFGSWSTFSRGC